MGASRGWERARMVKRLDSERGKRGLRAGTAIAGAASLVVLGLAPTGVLSNIARSDQTTPIKHVVVIMEENHTFDNYFGAFPGVNNNPVGPSGQPWGVTEPAASDPLPYDLDHSGPRAYGAIDGGKMDNFDPMGDVQYSASDIPTYWSYAQKFGLGENFFTSISSSSTPNHIAMIAGQSGGDFLHV